MSNWFQPVPLFEGEDEAELKREFARLWARHPTFSHLDIGTQLFKDRREPLRGLQAGAVWVRELDVLEMVKEFERNGEAEEDVASKDQITREVLALARNNMVETKDRLAAYRLAAELNGQIEKPGANINVAIANRVMMVTDHGTNDEWEAKAFEQQQRLLENASQTTAN